MLNTHTPALMKVIKTNRFHKFILNLRESVNDFKNKMFYLYKFKVRYRNIRFCDSTLHIIIDNI